MKFTHAWQYVGTPHSEDLCSLRAQLCLGRAAWAAFVYLHAETRVQNCASRGQPMTYRDINPRVYCCVLSAGKCLTMYTNCRNSTNWDHRLLHSPIVTELIRDVGDLSVSSCSSEFRTLPWCWSYHIPDDRISITFLALLYSTPLPFCVLTTRSWHNLPDDILVRNCTLLSLTVNKSVCWWKRQKLFQSALFSTKMGIFSRCDPL